MIKLAVSNKHFASGLRHITEIQQNISKIGQIFGRFRHCETNKSLPLNQGLSTFFLPLTPCQLPNIKFPLCFCLLTSAVEKTKYCNFSIMKFTPRIGKIHPQGKHLLPVENPCPKRRDNALFKLLLSTAKRKHTYLFWVWRTQYLLKLYSGKQKVKFLCKGLYNCTKHHVLKLAFYRLAQFGIV